MSSELLTRNEFCEIIKEVFYAEGMTLLFNKFESASLSETENYIFYNDEGGDVSIIAKYSLDGTPIVINWYKLYHVGRLFSLNGIKNETCLKEVLYDVLADLKNEKDIDL